MTKKVFKIQLLVRLIKTLFGLLNGELPISKNFCVHLPNYYYRYHQTPLQNVTNNPLLTLHLPLQVPLEYFPENVLSISFEDISMARNQRREIPLINNLEAIAHAVAVLREMPVDSLGPGSVAAGMLHTLEQLIQKTTGPLRLRHLTVLLGSRQIEHQIRLDQNLIWPVVEDYFLVGVAIDVLIVEIGVKLLADSDVALSLLCEDNGKFVIVDFWVFELLCALLGETFWANNFGFGPLLGPFRDEDVVLKVKSDDVGYVASQLCDLGLGFLGEGNRREDGEIARCEPHYWTVSTGVGETFRTLSLIMWEW